MRRVFCILVLSCLALACTPGSDFSENVTQPVSPTSPSPSPVEDDSYAEARERLVKEGIIGWGIKDPAVIEAMGKVPRHEFVPDEYKDLAYANHPLSIGYGQTISQPYIVALMTEELGAAQGDRVLEIGTGSGYQAAVLAELGAEVYSMEIIGPLASSAAERLERLGYQNVHVRHEDGYFGWPDMAPFDAIIVTAAPDHIPQPLLAQIKVTGVMVIPVGPVGGYQELWKITRTGEDTFSSTSLGGCRFVPFVREGEESQQ